VSSKVTFSLAGRRAVVAAPGWRIGLRLAGPLTVWAGFALLLIPYAAFRGIGDEFFQPHDLKGIETGLFGGVMPSGWLQVHLHQINARNLDYTMFLAHLSWFFLPFVFGIVVACTERKKLVEFYAWLLVLSYLSTVLFLIAPTRPPWMEDGVTRVLVERSFIHYAELDNNEFAAFPSLHAALPLCMALFFFLRSDRKKGYGFIVLADCLWVSFAIVYLGEHWVVDVIGGWMLAGLVAFLFLSRHVRRAVHAVPGDPLMRLIRFNEWVMDLGVRREPSSSVHVPVAGSDSDGQRWAA